MKKYIVTLEKSDRNDYRPQNGAFIIREETCVILVIVSEDLPLAYDCALRKFPGATVKEVKQIEEKTSETSKPFDPSEVPTSKQIEAANAAKGVIKLPEKITAYWHNHDGDGHFFFRWLEGTTKYGFTLPDKSYHATLEEMERNWPGRYNFAVGACPEPKPSHVCTECRKYGYSDLGTGCPGPCEIVEVGNSVSVRP